MAIHSKHLKTPTTRRRPLQDNTHLELCSETAPHRMSNFTHPSLFVQPQRRSNMRGPTPVYPSFTLVLFRQSLQPHKKRKRRPVIQSVGGWGMTTVDYRPEPTLPDGLRTESVEYHRKSSAINLVPEPKPDDHSEVGSSITGDHTNLYVILSTSKKF
ncbi:hypothetical protein BD410DRAFT_5438 [Rickenella mellea]|uniref:Uncharacterized protein n=1 Tax=Rickenella mellea TaxID=50990 RepID=A0A4R5XF00_9AGAM|nr:hypothetical protein BD410DRAFT_5438 [Rickenella mellea]